MLRLRTFGSVELEDPDGRDLRPVLAQPKRLALLIYLAASRPFAVHRRDELLALFWPELDDARARDALNQAMRFLRQVLGQDTFVRRGVERERKVLQESAARGARQLAEENAMGEALMLAIDW